MSASPPRLQFQHEAPSMLMLSIDAHAHRLGYATNITPDHASDFLNQLIHDYENIKILLQVQGRREDLPRKSHVMVTSITPTHLHIIFMHPVRTVHIINSSLSCIP